MDNFYIGKWGGGGGGGGVVGGGPGAREGRLRGKAVGCRGGLARINLVA